MRRLRRGTRLLLVALTTLATLVLLAALSFSGRPRSASTRRLTLFLDDGRIELDTNIVERGIRPIVLNRKNALFAGHDEGAENWACIASLIETCKLNGADPQAYFADVLTRLINLWPASLLDELMPWVWAAEHSNRKLAA
jgi:transposase